MTITLLAVDTRQVMTEDTLQNLHTQLETHARAMMTLLDRSRRGEDVTEELDQLRGTIEAVKAIYEGVLKQMKS